MDETKWDIKEVKHLKKKQVIQNNLVMLLLFVLLVFFADNGMHSLIIGIFFLLIWIILAITLYTLKTGRPIGTKTSRLVQEFDRNRLGEKRWKQNRIAEAVIISVIGVGIAVLWFVKDVNSFGLDFPSYAIPFIGSWIGYNLGEIIRMYNF